MGPSENNRAVLPVRSPEPKLEMATAAGANCPRGRPENTRPWASWRCGQSDTNRSPCDYANISVILEKNAEAAVKNVKKTCGTGVSGILRQFDIREEQGACF